MKKKDNATQMVHEYEPDESDKPAEKMTMMMTTKTTTERKRHKNTKPKSNQRNVQAFLDYGRSFHTESISMLRLQFHCFAHSAHSDHQLYNSTIASPKRSI